jgi:hypothetical protein
MKRPDNLQDYIDKFYVVHGKAGVNFFNNQKYDYIPNVDKNLHIITATSVFNNFNSDRLTKHPDKLNFTLIKLNNFHCFVDKIKIILDFAKACNEKYIMWVDYSDTILPADIPNAKDILDFYNCKLLFNAEDGYYMPGHPCIDQSYKQLYFKKHNKEYHTNYHILVGDYNSEKLRDITSLPFKRSLNAGVFLGERDFIIECFEKTYSYMIDDYNKGYPYGEQDDQLILRYMQSKDDNIQIDYLNKFFLWVHDRKFTFPTDSWEHYDYFNRNIKPNE